MLRIEPATKRVSRLHSQRSLRPLKEYIMQREWHWVEEGVHATYYCRQCGTITSWRLVRFVRSNQANVKQEGIFSCVCCGKETTQKEAQEWVHQS